MASATKSRDAVVTIGIPVYNGARYLPETLDSISRQTYKALEIHIADNASTDESVAIANDFAERDSRVTVRVHATNVGAPRNWNSLAEGATGKYFKWWSSNDLCDPEFIARCVATLESDHDIALCYTDTRFIDSDGMSLGEYSDPLVADQHDAEHRFRSLLETLDLANAQAGVIRTSALRRTHLEGLYRAGDIDLLAELVLYGKIVRLDEPLHMRRMSADACTVDVSDEQVQQVLRPSKSDRFALDRWRSHLSLLRRINTAPLGLRQRLRLTGYQVRRMVWQRDMLCEELKHAFSRRARRNTVKPA